MTFRESTNVYGGTYTTTMYVSMGVATVGTAMYAAHSFWRYLLIGLPLLVATQFLLNVLAWQFTEYRRKKNARVGAES